MLEGTEVEIERTITSLTYDSETELVTAVVNNDHRLKSGVRVNVSGATETEYNIRVSVIVVDPVTFTYTPREVPTITTATGSPEMLYRNIVDHAIKEASELAGTFTFITHKSHGFKNGINITIEGTTNYNGTYGPITLINNTEFTTGGVIGTATETFLTPDDAMVFFQPQDGDYVDANDQFFSSENGLYIARESNWEFYDNSKITESTILFMKQNIFDITDNNPDVAKGREFGISSITRSSNVVTVKLHENHEYIPGTTITINNIRQLEYNGIFSVATVPDGKTLTYLIKTTDEPETPGSDRSPRTTMTCQEDRWYKYTVNSIDWQQKSNALTYTTAEDKREFFFRNDAHTGHNYSNHIFGLGGEYKYISLHSITSIDETLDTFIVPSAEGFHVGDTVVYNANSDTITGMVDGDTYTVSGVTSTVVVQSIALTNSEGNEILFGGLESVTDASFTHILPKFDEGDIVNVEDQFIESENGKYRVQKGKWRKLDKRLIAKLRDIIVDSILYNNPAIVETDDPMLYNTYNDSHVNDFIVDNFTGNQQIFKIDNNLVGNSKFIFEKVDKIDTTDSYHQIYDAKFDKNTVVDTSDMSKDFVGINDMKYPLMEKIERLVYLKDANVIDFEFISKLARYMGYDITNVLDDITDSVFYKDKHERENALRKTIQNLPQFNSLKSTKGGLEAVLLTFGIVGKVITLWTETNHPYEEFYPDYMIRDLQLQKMNDGENINLVPTPHFKLHLNIDGNFDNQINAKEKQQIDLTVNKFKPINTVFDGLIAFIEETLKATIFIKDMNARGRMQCDIGFTGIEFDSGEQFNNDCI
jgi:hypothetical protein